MILTSFKLCAPESQRDLPSLYIMKTGQESTESQGFCSPGIANNYCLMSRKDTRKFSNCQMPKN
jgi:hypothetical protein